MTLMLRDLYKSTKTAIFVIPGLTRNPVISMSSGYRSCPGLGSWFAGMTVFIGFAKVSLSEPM